jgi:hypothetical protein
MFTAQGDTSLGLDFRLDPGVMGYGVPARGVVKLPDMSMG